ncbi:MAG: hypothetical protein N3D75_04120 [Candidatus Aenigmarchaeota archaeon]|nr:hypothetical protein [Candidatus Aenigmarchaeota archaeon]
MKGISAVIATLLLLVITIGLAMTVYFYVNNMASRQTAKVIDVQPYCSRNIITLVITNIGTEPINGDNTNGYDLKYSLDNGQLTNIALSSPLNPRATTTYTIATQPGQHTLILVSPSGSTRLSVFC